MPENMFRSTWHVDTALCPTMNAREPGSNVPHKRANPLPNVQVWYARRYTRHYSRRSYTTMGSFYPTTKSLFFVCTNSFLTIFIFLYIYMRSYLFLNIYFITFTHISFICYLYIYINTYIYISHITV